MKVRKDDTFPPMRRRGNENTRIREKFIISWISFYYYLCQIISPRAYECLFKYQQRVHVHIDNHGRRGASIYFPSKSDYRAICISLSFPKFLHSFKFQPSNTSD